MRTRTRHPRGIDISAFRRDVAEPRLPFPDFGLMFAKTIAIGFTRACCVQSGFELSLVNTHGHRVHMSNCTVKYAARRGRVGSLRARQRRIDATAINGISVNSITQARNEKTKLELPQEPG